MEELPVRDWLEISIDTDMGVLGIGAFGYILKGKFDGREVAVKKVPHKDHDLNEEEAMLTLDHPNIVKLFLCESDDNIRYYALELCVASLDHLFLKTDDHKKYNGPMPRRIEVFQHLALGLEHIHSKDLVHGDIRPENVLISVGSAGPDEITIKWADFGLNRNVDVQGTAIKGEARGKNAWLAPELLKLSGTKNHGTAKGDVFAQGLVFGTLFLNGEHLYGSMENGNEILDNIINGNPINMQKINSKIRGLYEDELFKKMLEDDPSKRTTSTQVVNQLKAIKNQIAGNEEEKELLELCGRDSPLDLTGKIQNFIQFGVNLNAKDDEGRNALHLLCQNYSRPRLTDAIKLLIENGIDVNAKDDDGLNAIHYLCRYHSSQNLITAIQILTQYGIDAKATTNDGSNALHYLCRYNSNPNLIDAMKILTHFGVDLMTEDNSGWSAFYYLKNKDKKEMKIWFDRDARLGVGGFGVVFKGKFGGREVAVKRVELHLSTQREEEAMLKLDHPNIVKLFHFESDDDFRYYAMELCDASLNHLFLHPDDPRKYNRPMPRHIEAFQQLASGLEHIHSKNLAYRDIKPSDILISATSARQPIEVTLKWCDFGLAKSVNEKGLYSWSGVRGTRTWYAPEVLKKLIKEENAEEEEFWGTVQSDVFVLGLVFGYLFLKGEHLYGSSEKEIHKNIIEGNPVNLQEIDDKLREMYENNLFRKMLVNDPRKRLTSKEVVEQLKSIKEKLARKEGELHQLCASNSQVNLANKIHDLSRYGIDMNAKGNYGWNALHFLCRYNSDVNLIESITLLKELGLDMNAKSNKGWNALHIVCRFHSTTNVTGAMKLLIDLGIDVNAKDDDGCNALHHLCENNSCSNLVGSIELLIQVGTDVNARDCDGLNALLYLCRYNSSSNLIAAMRHLIQSGIGAKKKSKDGSNALHFLCRYNSSSSLTEAIQFLIESGFDPKEKSNDGSYALHYLCRNNPSSNSKHAINYLLKFGIALDEKDNDGRTIMDYWGDRIEKNMEIQLDRKSDILGRGSFGSVWRGMFKGQKVAVKRVEVHLVNENEQIAMENLDHPNIIKLLHSEFNKDFTYYALELCDASLAHLFLESSHPKKYKGPMPRRIDVFLQLASGLEYIHSKGFTHRDIKPGNILISVGHEDHKEEVTIKWADFGLSRPVNERGTFTPSRITGTKTWSAPEIVRRYRQGEECRGDVKSDVFALALVFGWLFLYGKNLYGSNEFEIENNIIERRPINMQKIDSKLRDLYENDLLTKMLEDEHGNRISSADVVKRLKSIKEKITGDEDKNWFNEVPEKSKEI